MTFEPVIGLEIHAQLRTETKMFCGCAAQFGAPPNTQVCPVCLGLPGALPVLNRRAVELALRVAIALGCRIHPVSVFARKNYFYPDLPKGYQISQYDQPLATDGRVVFVAGDEPRQVGILRVHLEEDAGKSLHEGFPDSDRQTYVDFNRSGVPLVEIVTRPDLRSGEEAADFFERLRAVLIEIGACDGNMEEGSLRCDANVSVRPAGDPALGTRTEVKNLNSFRFLERALKFEIGRQSDLVRSGGRVEADTRLWDVAGGRTVVMRTKEEAHDYRYFPEPDLPPLQLSGKFVAKVQAELPELPEARRRRLMATYALPGYDASLLAASAPLARYFEAVAAGSGNPKVASNWIMGELLRKTKETGVTVERVPVRAEALAGLIRLVDQDAISGPVAKEIFQKMWATGRAAEDICRAEDLGQINDESTLSAIVHDVVTGHPKAVAQYQSGKALAFEFLVGQVMKATKGRANPHLVNSLLARAVGRGGS